jgi:hypothetical protein
MTGGLETFFEESSFDRLFSTTVNFPTVDLILAGEGTPKEVKKRHQNVASLGRAHCLPGTLRRLYHNETKSDGSSPAIEDSKHALVSFMKLLKHPKLGNIYIDCRY